MARLSETRSRHQAYVSAANHGNSQFRPLNLLLQAFHSRFESDPCERYIADCWTARAAFSFLEFRRQGERSAVTATLTVSEPAVLFAPCSMAVHMEPYAIWFDATIRQKPQIQSHRNPEKRILRPLEQLGRSREVVTRRPRQHELRFCRAAREVASERIRIPSAGECASRPSTRKAEDLGFLEVGHPRKRWQIP